MSIDLTQVDWNKLSPEQFKEINAKLLSDKKIAKQSRTESPKTGEQLVKIKGKLYRIKQSEFTRIQTYRSQKSKEKYLDMIVAKYNPVPEI